MTALSCDYASVDIVDILGTKERDLHKNINRFSVDHLNREIAFEGKLMVVTHYYVNYLFYYIPNLHRKTGAGKSCAMMSTMITKLCMRMVSMPDR